MGWLSGYSKRKPITLTGGASGAQTDFQLKLAAAYAAAMQSDFDDLRFTQADGATLIDAWLESKVDDTSAVVWAEFPTTPANTVEQTYYMYYGNAGAANYWDIGATFIFGDDFSGDLSKWTIDAGSPEIVGGVLQVDGGENMHADVSCSNAAWEFKVRHTQTSPLTYTRIFLRVGTADKYATNDWEGTIQYGIYDNVDAGWVFSNAQADDTNWHDEKTTRDENSLWKCWHDAAYIGSATDTTTTSFDNICFKGHNAHVEYDNVRVRKHVISPPTYAFGSEEYVPAGILRNPSMSGGMV